MAGVLCSMVGASFTVAAVAQILRSKKGITAVGNAQVDTAQSQFGGASALFDGTGDYLIVGNTVDSGLALAENAWTIEFWARINSHSGSYNNVIGIWNDSGDGSGSVFYISTNMFNTSNKLGIQYIYSGDNNSGAIQFGSALSTGVWQHHAFVRNGNTLTVYTAGTSVGTHDMTGRTIDISGLNTSGVTSLKMTIGAMTGGGGGYNGWLDEIRVSDSARYTSNFTAPTAPFVNDANTVLLIHADGTDASTFFEDDNGVRAQRGIVSENGAQISTAQSRFGGSSAQFDGTNDFLRFAQSDDFTFGTNNFTVEMWVRLNATTGEFRPVFSLDGNGFPLVMFQMTSNVMEGYISTTGSSWTFANVNLGTFTTGTWYHICVVRDGSTFRWFLNGTQTQTRTSSGSIRSQRSQGRIGTSDSAFYWNGWVDEVRISNTARYTSNFTSPTTPFTNDANTVLLIHADGTNASTVFKDDNGQGRSSRGIIANGNAQVSTAQSQFGGASALFDGTGDFLSTTSVAWHSQSTGTIEYWFRHNTTAPFGHGHLGQFTQGSANGWEIGTFSNKLYWFNSAGTGDLAYDFTLSANTWYHVAVVKESSSVLKIYVDGTLRYTNSSMGAFTDSTSDLLIGRIGGTASSLYNSERWDLNGYLDEIRISSTARYTAGFTPSTTPFQNDANTVLLLHGDGTNNSTVFTDDNGIAPYTP
jgi:hypothetical protein